MSVQPRSDHTVTPSRDGLLPRDLGLRADTIRVLAVQCDKMCLDAGSHLCEAVPGLGDVSTGFGSLSNMLGREDVIAATRTLRDVAGDVATIGLGLTAERIALENVATLNQNLSRRMIGIASEVRILAAIVPYVKMELATIDRQGETLDDFASTLERLASNAVGTIGAFQETQGHLQTQLRAASDAQSTFEASHKDKLVSVARDIETALDIVSTRRGSVSDSASEIGAIAQAIGTQIAQSVVALQIGDSTRQRIEHAEAALTMIVDFLAGQAVDGITFSSNATPLDETRNALAAKIGALQTLQLTDAANEFHSEVATIVTSLEQMTASVEGLLSRSEALFGSMDSSSRSFLGDLETNLEAARHLIDECRLSRAAVDHITETLIAAIQSLEQLVARISIVSVEMTIIGTNAIVTAHRLGSRGAALSVIAQELRSHALRVADAVKLLSPALTEVLRSSETVKTARAGQDAASMAMLAENMANGMGVFGACDQSLGEMRRKLRQEASAVKAVLHLAFSGLSEADDVHHALHEAATDLTPSVPTPYEDSAYVNVTTSLGQLLRQRYTMAVERDIHDAFFSTDDRGDPILETAATPGALA